MSPRPFRIGRSKTGLGLFATKFIKKRTRIVEYKGRKLPNEEAERLEAKGARYMYELNKHYTLDGSSRRNVARYANHSCRPNSESLIYRGRVFIKSVRNIKPGDEITYHYGKDYYDIYIGKRRCRCVTCTLRRARERLKRKKRLERRARAAAKARAAKRKAARRRTSR
jgi:SET domain-containing protein